MSDTEHKDLNNKNNKESSGGSGWLDETGTIPDAAGWLDETGAIPEAAEWLDETGTIPEAAEWLDETGNIPDAAEWLDETGALPGAAELLDEEKGRPVILALSDAPESVTVPTQEKSAEQDWLDETGHLPAVESDWDFDESGKPIRTAEEEPDNGEDTGEERAEAPAKKHEEESEENSEEKPEPEEKSNSEEKQPGGEGGENTRSGKRKLIRAACLGAAAVAAALAVFAGVSYWNGLRQIEAQRLAIRDVGEQMADLDLDAGNSIQAVADTRIAEEKEEKARQQAEEKKAREEKARNDKLEGDEESVPVELSLSTIQSDLKVKIRDAKTKSLIGDVPFKIRVKLPSGKTEEYEDDDEDGIIYKTGLASGKYEIALEPLIDTDKIREESRKKGTDYHDNEDYILYSKFAIPEDPQSISITDKIAYEVVDVKDEIKSASEVNTAKEDTAHNDTVVEGTLQNTVALVDSSKTEITAPSADAAQGQSAAAGADTAAAAVSTDAAGAAQAAAGNTAAGAATAVQNGEGADTAGTAQSSAAGAAETENAAAGTGEGAEAAASEDTSGGASGTQEQPVSYMYTGWQTIDGKTYYFDANGVYVTGTQVIGGITYTFGDDGVLNTSASRTGIDVSQWNGTVNWSAVASSGISFAIVRCGYRGSSQGMLVADPMAGTNIMGAKNAGLKVGLYFFSQAVNEAEAVEEASMAVQMANTYGINMPIYLDVETSGGRGDTVSVAQRTANIAAFCQTVANAGYSAGVYANTNWLTEKINAPALTGYHIWLAQYAAAPTYSATAFHMWQYTSTGHVNGISGNVDLNILY